MVLRGVKINVQVGDKDRGYLLELLLTKIRYARGCEEFIPSSNTQTRTSSSAKCTVLQIVGMSATMPNVCEVAKWLQVPLCRSPITLLNYMRNSTSSFTYCNRSLFDEFISLML